MEISAFSPASIWNAVTRALTNMGSGAMPLGQLVNASIAATTVVDLRPALNRFASISIAATANASGTIQIRFTDGTNIWNAVTIAVSTTGGITDITGVNISGQGVGCQIINNSTVAATYWYASMNLQQ